MRERETTSLGGAVGVSALGSVLFLGGCAGTIGDRDESKTLGDPPATASTTPMTPPPPPADATRPEDFFPGSARQPSPSRYWRLSWEQYDYAVSDLVGADVHPSVEAGFPKELPGFAGWLHQARALDAKEIL